MKNSANLGTDKPCTHQARLAAETLEAARESERQRIARDIHDDLGQTLLALKIELSIAQIGAGSAHPLLRRRLNAMAEKLDQAIVSLRAAIHQLHPPALAKGLRPALATLVADFVRLNHIDCSLDLAPNAPDDGADADRDAMLFHIVQEALANIARHAQASAVQLALRIDGEQLQLTVRDNGVGMAGNQAACAHGCGLAGIRQRVQSLGGACDVASAPGGGTLLRLNLPLGQAIAAH